MSGTIGLRVDVDTLRGVRKGVPVLLGLLAGEGIQGSFFFSVGPDNMGRHLWRLLRPAFLRKMVRTRAASLYGWDIFLRGTLWPGPRIGEQAADMIRLTRARGHEVGLHAWDHHAWQAHLGRMSSVELSAELRRGYDTLAAILGEPPACSAAPAWRVTDRALLEKEQYPFRYNSDCRGSSLFFPVVEGRALGQPQIPTTLPTYDERVGRGGIRPGDWNDWLLARLRPGSLNVLTIHAEVEGIACAECFSRFVAEALSRGWRFAPLSAFLDQGTEIRLGRIQPGQVAGREGWVSCQTKA